MANVILLFLVVDVLLLLQDIIFLRGLILLRSLLFVTGPDLLMPGILFINTFMRLFGNSNITKFFFV